MTFRAGGGRREDEKAARGVDKGNKKMGRKHEIDKRALDDDVHYGVTQLMSYRLPH